MVRKLRRRFTTTVVVVAICAAAAACTESGRREPRREERTSKIIVDWPRDRALLAEKQVFLMHIDGLGPTLYRAYWQVDERAPHEMEVSEFGRPGKESEVDINDWTTSPFGEHRLTFYAEDATGNRIETKEIVAYGARLTVVDRPENNMPANLHRFVGGLDGVPVDLYSMSWRVDGGQYNEMDNLPGGEKFSNIDVSGWNWRKNGYYAIEFIITDKSGSEVVAPYLHILQVSNI